MTNISPANTNLNTRKIGGRTTSNPFKSPLGAVVPTPKRTNRHVPTPKMNKKTPIKLPSLKTPTASRLPVVPQNDSNPNKGLLRQIGIGKAPGVDFFEMFNPGMQKTKKLGI